MVKERRRVFYSGRVQGVGFRFESQRLAQGFDVAGYVRNLDDGRVELLIEGPSPEISRLLDAIGREMGAKIHDVHVEQETVGEPPLSGFMIRY